LFCSVLPVSMQNYETERAANWVSNVIRWSGFPPHPLQTPFISAFPESVHARLQRSCSDKTSDAQIIYFQVQRQHFWHRYFEIRQDTQGLRQDHIGFVKLKYSQVYHISDQRYSSFHRQLPASSKISVKKRKTQLGASMQRWPYNWNRPSVQILSLDAMLISNFSFIHSQNVRAETISRETITSPRTLNLEMSFINN